MILETGALTTLHCSTPVFDATPVGRNGLPQDDKLQGETRSLLEDSFNLEGIKRDIAQRVLLRGAGMLGGWLM